MTPNNTESGWPLVLSAEATVPSQTTQRPPQLALMNPTGEAFKIHEVRWSIRSDVPYLTGANIGCKLDIGKLAITNGFVPIWNFGKVVSYDQDLSCQYSWRLQHPMYVPSGGMVTTDFQNFGQSSADATVRVSYFCTSIPEEDKRVSRRMFLPYVSAFIGKTLAYATADTDRSRETDLQNPFDGDMKISRLIGRFNLYNAAADANTSIRAGRLLSVRVSLSNGDPLVRVSTPLEQVFSQDGHVWEQHNTILKPKQFFQVFVDKAATTDTSANSTLQTYVSLVGYRELELRTDL